jgi:hypothetical protein
VFDGRLELSCRYSAHLHRSDTVESILADALHALAKAARRLDQC